MKLEPGVIPSFSVGGQAVIEGVMMRSPSAVATAVRKADGSIVVTRRPFRGVANKYKFLNIPIVRGGINLIETLVLGMQALNYSADQAMEEEKDKPRRQEQPAWRQQLAMGVTMVVAFGLGLGFFFYLPLVLTEWTGVTGGVAFNLVDGAFRVVFFVAYLYGISLWKEMRRVFEYHGAEHKSIFVFEAGLPLEPEESRRFTTLHPRCGTSFLLLVMLTSIVVFSFLGKPETIADRLERLAFVPVIAGIAYELIKLSGKKACQRWMMPLILPGLWLQKITTKEPSLDQVEVAMTAIRACLAYEGREARRPPRASALTLQGCREPRARSSSLARATATRRCGSMQAPTLGARDRIRSAAVGMNGGEFHDRTGETPRHHRQIRDPSSASSWIRRSPRDLQPAAGSLSREHSRLREIVEVARQYQKVHADLEGARELSRQSDDSEMRALASQEADELRDRGLEIEARLELLLVPPDPLAEKNTIVEVRAGTGGDEAALFAAELRAHVPALRRTSRLEDGDAVLEPDRHRRLQGNHLFGEWDRCVRASALRERRASRAARARDRGAAAGSTLRRRRWRCCRKWKKSRSR